ncbi:hypothetical protein ONV78_24310 [Hahella sp. CR1]|uniref:DUF7210 family protein n=1 Tax=Hahella sp. CR1 TaxID=2992807 RepID=UPI002441A5D8|nr:hypothetical protein [Hahella sp. CR1]MDG9670885.1 hypothetical protein [Hahella sp. CR1]
MKLNLLCPHIHAGVAYSPGDCIEVDAAAARWLIELGVAEAITSTKAAQTKDRIPHPKGN